jgi:hypothetical protein
LSCAAAQRAGDLAGDAQAALDRQGASRITSWASDSPSRNSITTKARPSLVVPKSVTSTMFSWPIELASRASCNRRATSSGFSRNFSSRTLTATRLPMTVWRASYTAPIPPSPMRRTIS